MPRASAGRIGPIVAGLAGLAWFWFELAPQRAGFEDTDNPSIGLRFIAAHPEAWPLTGIALGVAAIGLIVTMLVVSARLRRTAPSADHNDHRPDIAIDTITVLGLIGAAMLLAMGVLRLSGGPLLYVRGLEQSWGEASYLVLQFVGVQLLLPGGLVLLAAWELSIAAIGARRGLVPRWLALLALLPAGRLLGILGPMGFELDGLWLLTIVAIPAAFLWLLALGAARPYDGDRYTSHELRTARDPSTLTRGAADA